MERPPPPPPPTCNSKHQQRYGAPRTSCSPLQQRFLTFATLCNVFQHQHLGQNWTWSAICNWSASLNLNNLQRRTCYLQMDDMFSHFHVQVIATVPPCFQRLSPVTLHLHAKLYFDLFVVVVVVVVVVAVVVVVVGATHGSSRGQRTQPPPADRKAPGPLGKPKQQRNTATNDTCRQKRKRTTAKQAEAPARQETDTAQNHQKKKNILVSEKPKPPTTQRKKTHTQGEAPELQTTNTSHNNQKKKGRAEPQSQEQTPTQPRKGRRRTSTPQPRLRQTKGNLQGGQKPSSAERQTPATGKREERKLKQPAEDPALGCVRTRI